MAAYDFVIVGGGIVGLATGMELVRRRPGTRLLVIEKEPELALHQTGQNSGVIHSGIYYKPGSFKARFARQGSRSMVDFCHQHAIPHEVCGKVIVAVAPDELPRLEQLCQRGLENGLKIEKLTGEQVRELEPHVSCVAGIRVPSTGIVNYRQVCLKYADLIRRGGGEIRTGARLRTVTPCPSGLTLETTDGAFEAKFLINCAGLYSDRVARMAGLDPGARIVPFRGEYFELTPGKRHLVKTLIYPVPNPDFPFLGVHFTRMIDGSVHAGPNAVLAFHREGYTKCRFSARDTAETLLHAGFWRMVWPNRREGLAEMRRSFSKTRFLKSLQQMLPEVADDDLVPAEAGVRAQALFPDGRLVDDFLIRRGPNSLHVCNAPSPAATASLEIGRHIVEQIG